MTIVPASALTASEFALLGNNLRRPGRKRRQRKRQRISIVRAVNRSLASVGERVQALHRPPLVA